MLLPDPEIRRNAYQWFGRAFVLYGVFELFYPATTRPTGRWSWLVGYLRDIAGNTGLAVYWLSVGAALLVLSLKRSSKE